MSPGIWKNALDFMGAMTMQVSIEVRKVSFQIMMRYRLQGFHEGWIINETNSFGLDFAKRAERLFRAPPNKWEQYSREERI